MAFSEKAMITPRLPSKAFRQREKTFGQDSVPIDSNPDNKSAPRRVPTGRGANETGRRRRREECGEFGNRTDGHRPTCPRSEYRRGREKRCGKTSGNVERASEVRLQEARESAPVSWLRTDDERLGRRKRRGLFRQNNRQGRRRQGVEPLNHKDTETQRAYGLSF